LRLESLERRELLAVTLLPGEQFASPSFISTASLTGTYSAKMDGLNLAIPFKGTATITDSTASYTSPTQGTFDLASITGSGTWAFDGRNGTFTLSDGSASGTDNKGTAADAIANGSIQIFSSDGTLIESSSLTDATATGTFNMPEESMSLNINQSPVSITMSGPIQLQPSPGQYSASVTTASWGAISNNLALPKSLSSAENSTPALLVSVATQGSPQKSTSGSYTTPVANVDLYWATKSWVATKPTTGSTAITQDIGIDWNETSGSYAITGLPTPPSSATQVLLVPKFGGKLQWTQASSLALPTLPTASISDTTVTRLKTGTVKASFTVTLSNANPFPFPFPVTVNYDTANGGGTGDTNAVAHSGTDYVGIPKGSVTFPAGATSEAITVTVLANAKATVPEDFRVILTGAIDATLTGGQSTAIGTIDPPKTGTTNAVLQATAAGSRAVPSLSTARPRKTSALSSVFDAALSELGL
jgi:hypothetical protein